MAKEKEKEVVEEVEVLETEHVGDPAETEPKGPTTIEVTIDQIHETKEDSFQKGLAQGYAYGYAQGVIAGTAKGADLASLKEVKESFDNE